MMWQDLTHTRANWQFKCHRLAKLVNDAGVELGMLMHFYKDGPSYAVLIDCRLGPHETFEQAQAAVENPANANPLAYVRTHRFDG